MKTILYSIAVALLACSVSPARAVIATGHPAPNFTAQDTNGHPISLADFKGKIVVLEWTNPKCPFVLKHYNSGNMQKLQKTYTAKGVIWITINSAAPGREGFGTAADANQIVAERGAAPSFVILDSSGVIGHLYDAKTTPHMFIISPDGTLMYHGGIDSIATHDIPDLARAKNYVAAALDEMLAGQPVKVSAAMPYGCAVKYAK